MVCVLEQCTIYEREPNETCRRAVGIRPSLEHGEKGEANEQILFFGAWARSLAFAVLFSPNNLFYK